MATSESPAAGLPLGQTDPSKDPEEDAKDENPMGGDVVMQADGSALIIEKMEEEQEKVGFGANLAEEMEEVELDQLASDILKKLERDKESRKKRDEQYKEGIQRTGLGNDAPGGADFPGASRAVHPMIAEGCVDFAASAMKELFPPNGPGKTKIDGEVTAQKLQIAKRQERCLNWQLTEQISEYAEELEQLLTQLPLGGSQYQKFWQDRTLRRICTEFVPIDDVLLPYACSDFYSAQRITHVQRLIQATFDERVEDEFYRDISAHESNQTPEQTAASQANDKVEGKEADMDNVDGERVVYEVNTFAELSVDSEERLPYLISIDENTKKVVAIYRNWEEKDEQHTRLEWMVEYGFIAWRGAYKIGLPHLIGGLSAAATGALRALLDSAHINNLPGFLRLKGARMGGQTKQVDVTQGVEIEASAAVDDIRKLVMALPYNPPSPTLFQLLGWLSEAGKGVVTTAEEKIGEANSQMPVGTTLALIEQGAKVFSSIHARLHRSQKRAFQIISRLNAKHLSTGEQMAKLGEVLATREDFGHPIAVIPVSDPNIFSETQRYAQMQMVLQLATGQMTAPLHDLYKVIKRIYSLAKIPEYDEFLPEPKKPSELNSVSENSAAMMGTPIMAFPEQDHMAHIEVHMRFLMDPMLGGAPFAAQKSMPVLMEHIKQHLAFLYAKTIFDICTEAVGHDLGEALKQKAYSPEVDRVLASASKSAHAVLMRQLSPLGPEIQKILQQIAQMQPPPVMDPSQAALEAAKMDKEARDKKTDTDAQIKSKDIEQRGQIAQQKLLADQGKDQNQQAQAAQQHGDKMQLDQSGQLLQQQKDETEAQFKERQLAHQREKDAADLALREEELRVKAGNDAAARQQADMHHQESLAANQQQQAADHNVQMQQHESSTQADLLKHGSGLQSQERQQQTSVEADWMKHKTGLDAQQAQKDKDLKAQKDSQQRDHQHQQKSQKTELSFAEKQAKQAAQQKAKDDKSKKPKG